MLHDARMSVLVSCVFVFATLCFLLFFFFNATATTEIYTLSLHDALPIFLADELHEIDRRQVAGRIVQEHVLRARVARDRKSTRLNSSHPSISYAVFCLKKKIAKSPSACQGRSAISIVFWSSVIVAGALQC